MTSAALSPSAASPAAGSEAVSIEQLRDLHLPEAVGLWPPAPGWWLLALLSAALLLGLAWWGYRRIQRNRYRRLALRELSALSQSELQREDPQRWLQHLNQLLRRTALAAYPPATVAPLSGNAWVDFLYRSSQIEGFRQPAGASLASGPYQQGTDIDRAALQGLAEQWIRKHHQRLQKHQHQGGLDANT